MKISVLQMHICPGDLHANLATLHRLMEKAMREEPDVLLLPELWNIGFYPKPLSGYAESESASRQCLADLSRQYRVNLAGGTIVSSQDGKFYNTCLVFDRAGNLVAQYSKTHLFSPMEEDKDFTPGNGTVSFSLDGIPCSVIVCYDLRFPELTRKLALNGIAVLLLPAEWPITRLLHWQTLLKARAIENQIFLAAANGAGSFPDGTRLAGYSAIIDPWGGILAEAGQEEAILHAVIQPSIRQDIKENMNVFADRRPELY